MQEFIELSIKLGLTVFLCGAIGLERDIRQKGAGLRTHALVGMGSMLIVLTSVHLFEIYKDVTIIDPTRMITGIVTGVGFLCAGTIIRAGTSVLGLTTAATLWIVSGIGIAVGAGHYSAAISTAIVVFFVLVGLRSIEKKVGGCMKKLKGKL